jgi:hypothetical protein
LEASLLGLLLDHTEGAEHNNFVGCFRRLHLLRDFLRALLEQLLVLGVQLAAAFDLLGDLRVALGASWLRAFRAGRARSTNVLTGTCA